MDIAQDTATPFGGTVVRRHYLMEEEGTASLVLSPSPTEQLERFSTFSDDTGVPDEQILSVPVVPVPLPVLLRNDDTSEIPRWSGVNPEMMWLPLFWLPERVALRYRYRVVDAEVGGTDEDSEVESDETWAIRVMLELQASGLYDGTDGTWLDVLAYYGLDADNPVDQARVAAWLEGDSDDVLDSIDLTPLFEIEGQEEDWALVAARELSEVFVPAQWALSAIRLHADIVEQVEARGDTDEVRRDVLRTFGRLCANDLRSVPEDPETGISIGELLTEIADQADEPTSDSAYLMDTLQLMLKQTANDYDPYLVGATSDGDVEYDGEPRFVE